ncbi:hypothetical protein P5673_018824 [Acropora cervicornis]|uniref:SWIM-type domain-containing protein n=1 Tax=Acropora cervicornis TaxID=6130 RepID=A0AAD9V2D5_ACRCE|nr:hypothetical protein P5673_018824 [Acropora cervicornis]
MLPLQGWVWAFRKDCLPVAVYTNNGLERQNEDFKYNHLATHRDKTLRGMLSVLITEFLPEKYSRYIERNVTSHTMHRGYNKDLPAFLVNRPRFFVEHCKQKIKLASDIDKTDIKTTDFPGVFEKGYRVRLSCECRAWQRSRLLCKHFFAVFNLHPEWNWENLPKEYRESPFITLDYHLLNGTGSPTQPSCTVSPEVIQCPLQLDEPLSKRLKCSSENDPFIPQALIPTKSKQLNRSDLLDAAIF